MRTDLLRELLDHRQLHPEKCEEVLNMWGPGHETTIFNGRKPWPPQSPDLSLLDFGIWSMITRIMPEADSLAQLRADIITTARTMPCTRYPVTEAFLKRCGQCLSACGGHFEFVGRAPTRRWVHFDMATAPTLTAEEMEAALGFLMVREFAMLDDDEYGLSPGEK